MEKMIKSISELEQFARKFFEQLPVKADGATVVGLSGDLGSGKTAFVKEVARILCISGEILSPTFVIAKFYEIHKHPSWSRLIHVDAYRIEDTPELKLLRWDELLADSRNVILVEWPEHIGTMFPSHAITLNFRFVDDTTRIISYAL